MPSLVFPALVRRQVLEQHGELRVVLERVIGRAAPVARDAVELAASAREMCGRFRVHLDFEEHALPPVFAVLDAWGPERVRDLRDVHARQRQVLDGLLGRFEAGGNVHELAGALRDLALDLLRDMEEEEDGCLRASLMSSDSLPVERR